MIKLVSLLLYSGAGFCLFLIFANRCLILLPDSRLKSPVILFAFLLLTGGAAWFGWTFPYLPWLLIPIAILGLIVIGEIRRAVIRRRCAGRPWVEATPCSIRFTRPFTTTDLVARRYQVALPKWQGPDFSIIHLTDLHINPKMPFEFYEQAVALVEQYHPDFVFFTGDFISKRESLPELRRLLRPLGKQGAFAVLGNHDYWADAEGVRAAIRDSGITLLTNESMTMSLGGEPIRISGVDYPWGGSERSLSASPADELHLVLSHTPDNCYWLSRSGVDAVFSGHYHAGQIRLPFLGPIIVPSVYGRRFDHGHFVINGAHLFVAGGLGAANPPFRIYCQPDFFIVEVAPPIFAQEAGKLS